MSFLKKLRKTGDAFNLIFGLHPAVHVGYKIFLQAILFITHLFKVPMHCYTCSHHNTSHKLRPVLRPLADDHLLRPAALSCCALVETTQAEPPLLLLPNMPHKLRPVMRPLVDDHLLRPAALSCCTLFLLRPFETTEANPSLSLFTET